MRSGIGQHSGGRAKDRRGNEGDTEARLGSRQGSGYRGNGDTKVGAGQRRESDNKGGGGTRGRAERKTRRQRALIGDYSDEDEGRGVDGLQAAASQLNAINLA